jgi:translation elongation factor EF-1alpha
MAIPYVLKSNSTNKIDYDLGYTQSFADSSSNLNVTETNYNIVPAKKIYDYVQNAISSLSSFDIYVISHLIITI